MPGLLKLLLQPIGQEVVLLTGNKAGQYWRPHGQQTVVHGRQTVHPATIIVLTPGHLCANPGVTSSHLG